MRITILEVLVAAVAETGLLDLVAVAAAGVFVLANKKCGNGSTSDS